MASVVESRLGALVIEGCLTLMLYGVLTVQAYVFLLSSKQESWCTRYTALAIWILESLVSAFMLHSLYHYTIVIFGQLELIDVVNWSAPSMYTADRIAVAIVQGFCVYRIWFLSGKSFSTIIPAMCWLAKTGLSFALLVMVWQLHTWTSIHNSRATRNVATSALSVGLATDLCVTLFMAYFLRRDKTGFKNTDNVIRVMITFVVNSGVAVVGSSTALLVTYLASSHSLAFFGFIGITSVSYANMYFGIVNANNRLRKQAAMIGNTSGQELLALQSHGRQYRSHTPIEILHVQETETAGDVSINVIKAAALNKEKALSLTPKSSTYMNEPVS